MVRGRWRGAPRTMPGPTKGCGARHRGAFSLHGPSLSRGLNSRGDVRFVHAAPAWVAHRRRALKMRAQDARISCEWARPPNVFRARGNGRGNGVLLRAKSSFEAAHHLHRPFGAFGDAVGPKRGFRLPWSLERQVVFGSSGGRRKPVKPKCRSRAVPRFTTRFSTGT